MFLRSRIRRLWTDSLRFHGKPCALLALGVRVCDTALTRSGTCVQPVLLAVAGGDG